MQDVAVIVLLVLAWVLGQIYVEWTGYHTGYKRPEPFLEFLGDSMMNRVSNGNKDTTLAGKWMLASMWFFVGR